MVGLIDQEESPLVRIAYGSGAKHPWHNLQDRLEEWVLESVGYQTVAKAYIN